MKTVAFLVAMVVVITHSLPFNDDGMANEVNTGDPMAMDFWMFGSNAFIEPDNETTGKLVAEYKEDADHNPEELGTYFEGDILMPNKLLARNGLVASSSRWPNGVVPYEIAGTFSTYELETLKWAFEEYHRRTCVRFKPRSREGDYISIVNGKSGCWSAVGRTGGKQTVNLQTPSCLMKRGTALHELMHALGFIHEQNRYERDSYITVMTENINPHMMDNFIKSPKSTAHGMGIGYDYSSVMHYSPMSFSKNGKPTIVAKKATNEAKLMGQRIGFSKADIAKINTMYRCNKDLKIDVRDFKRVTGSGK